MTIKCNICSTCLLDHVGDDQGSVNNTVDGMWMGQG